MSAGLGASIALATIGVAVLLALVLLLRGPDLANRVVSLDLSPGRAAIERIVPG